MYIDRVALPGIGINHILTFSDGRRMGVISHFDGRRELNLYDSSDPDAVPRSVSLSADEADRLSDVLNDVVTVDHLTLLESAVNGVDLAKIPVLAGSRFVDVSLGETQARTKTRASVVAVIRDGEVLASPEPSFVFEVGDVIVAAGSDTSVAALGRLAAAPNALGSPSKPPLGPCHPFDRAGRFRHIGARNSSRLPLGSVV